MVRQRAFEQHFSGVWRLLVVVLLTIGVFFRFANLDHKLYWHDEVYTSLRAAGFTSKEIGREIFNNQLFTPQDLQKFQQLKPGSSASDTIQSLAIEVPQHPPLYFLISRFWLHSFGSSITASRSLAALLSLLALPLMYALGRELFSSSFAALLATILLALSPFDVLFAQIARQYSFLTVTIIGSSFLLLKALRLPTWYNWGLYTLATVIGLYTHTFFVLTSIGHFVLIGFHLIKQENRTKYAFKFFISIATTILLYSPWLIIIITNSRQAVETSSWSNNSVDVLLLAKVWMLSFTALFLDLDFGFDSIETYLLRLPILILIVVAIYTVCRQTSRATWLFILTSIFVPFLMLALPDLLIGGRRSAVSRYLISCYPGVQLCLGYFLATRLVNGQKIWRLVLALLVTSSVASCTVSALADTWWSNVPSYFNAEVARKINANPVPLLLSDAGNDGTNLGNLISLSYLLKHDTKLLLLSSTPDLKLLQNNSKAFVFRPSKTLNTALEKQKYLAKKVLPYEQLWQLQHP